MYVRTGSSDFIEMIPIFFAVLVMVMIGVWALYFYVKRQDDNKELVTRKVKVLEKPVQQGNVEWYVMECENGERVKLRSFQANSVIIAVGDIGIVNYKGKTIQSFQRK